MSLLVLFDEAPAGGVTVNVGVVSLVLTPRTATIAYDTNVSVGTSALTLATLPATITTDINVNVATAALSLATLPATIAYDTNVSVGTAALTLTAFNPTVDVGGSVDVAVGVVSLSLQTFPATVEAGSAEVVRAKSGGKSSRKRYVVEVDGQLIQVATQADVLAVLQQASEIAEEQADIIEPPRIKVRTSAGKPVESKAVVAAIQQTQRRISKAHDEAKKRHEVDREISRLILKAIERQNEEDDIITMLVA